MVQRLVIQVITLRLREVEVKRKLVGATRAIRIGSETSIRKGMYAGETFVDAAEVGGLLGKYIVSFRIFSNNLDTTCAYIMIMEA